LRRVLGADRLGGSALARHLTATYGHHARRRRRCAHRHGGHTGAHARQELKGRRCDANSTSVRTERASPSLSAIVTTPHVPIFDLRQFSCLTHRYSHSKVRAYDCVRLSPMTPLPSLKAPPIQSCASTGTFRNRNTRPRRPRR